MRKVDLIDHVVQKTSITKVDVSASLEHTLTAIKHALIVGDSVFIRGFGTFSPKTRKAKVGRNIKKGEAVQIPAHNIPHFKPAAEFKAAMGRPAGSLNPENE